MLVALLAGWFAPPAHIFEQRWVSMPAAISWQTFQAARAASARPSFCTWKTVVTVPVIKLPSCRVS